MVTTRSATRATAGAIPVASQVHVTVEQLGLSGADEADQHNPLNARDRSVYEGYNFNRIKIGAGANAQLGDRSKTENVKGHGYRYLTISNSQAHIGDSRPYYDHCDLSYEAPCLHSCRKCVAQLLCVAVIALLLSQCLTFLGALTASYILSPVLRSTVHFCLRLSRSIRQLAFFVTATISPVVLTQFFGIFCAASILLRKSLRVLCHRGYRLIADSFLPENWERKAIDLVRPYRMAIL